MDPIPVFSQIKSFIQWICNDAEGAEQTQINFSRQCPVISQMRSAVEAISGDNEAALETQKEFGTFVGCMANGIPIVGHAKGTVHYILGDEKEGDAAMKAASHTTGVIGGAVAGLLVAGPVGAVAGGVSGGLAIDTTITATDSAINKTFKPYGIFDPISDPKNAGKWCDAAGGLVFDGLAGRCTGKIVQQIKLRNISKPSVILDNVVDTVLEDKVIPRILIPIVSEITLMIINGVQEMAFRVVRAGVRSVEKFIQKNLQTFDEKPCELTMGNEAVPVAKNFAEMLGVTFKDKGDVLEVYHNEKLIIVKSAAFKYFVNGNGGMECIENGVAYCLGNDGTIIKKVNPLAHAQSDLELKFNGSVYENAKDKWCDEELNRLEFVEFTYNFEKKKIFHTSCETLNGEERGSPFNSVQRHLMQIV